MARSKHTIPARIRAPRRVRAPEEPRGYGDPSHQRALARALKEFGIRLEAELASTSTTPPAPLPAICTARPRPGFFHPASRADIARVLRFFGEVCSYGLRSIELMRNEELGAGMQIGRLLVPGRILLYEQPLSPWVLAGRLPEREEERLRRAGAQVVVERLQTVVVWPGETLRDFMLFDGLMHEVGHHLIQQYRGKRAARVMRTRDHEALAVQFSHRCRELYQEAHPSTP